MQKKNFGKNNGLRHHFGVNQTSLMSQIHKKSLANNVLRIFLIQQHLKEGISIKKSICLLIKLRPKSNDGENWQKRTLCTIATSIKVKKKILYKMCVFAL